MPQGLHRLSRAGVVRRFDPAQFDRLVSRYERSVKREAARKADKRAEDAAWAKRSAECRDREKGVCQVCHCQTTRAFTGHPKFWGQAHHIVYRSAGGSDDLSNLAWVCGQCSSDEHLHKIDITGTGDKLVVQPGPNHGISAERSVR